MTAHNDVTDCISENDEKWVQSCVLKACCVDNRDRVVVFDIDSNIGDWIRSLLDVAERLVCLGQLDVHAFEPAPSTSDCLLHMIKADPRTTAAVTKPECLAMSSSRGSASLFLLDDCVGINSLHQDSLAVYTQSIVIVANTIDHYFQENNIKKVHLLKCDIDGTTWNSCMALRMSFDTNSFAYFSSNSTIVGIFAKFLKGCV